MAELSTVAAETAEAAATQILGVDVDSAKLNKAVKDMGHA